MQFPGCDSQYTTWSIILFASATTDTIYEKETYPAVVYVEFVGGSTYTDVNQCQPW